VALFELDYPARFRTSTETITILEQLCAVKRATTRRTVFDRNTSRILKTSRLGPDTID